VRAVDSAALRVALGVRFRAARPGALPPVPAAVHRAQPRARRPLR
jgi:hypothetical protein